MKAPYKTKQKELLISYLSDTKGSHITVMDIQKYFQDKEITIGQTTIYRHLEKLVEEGLVSKYQLDGKGAYFEYVGNHNHCNLCYHFKCEQCGTLFHIHCHSLEKVSKHLDVNHGFRLNTMKTVLYGLCKECR
ncbi:MAG: transcriptional repressor [Erysipelotrichaceae bacterium]|nr:transcriptional repressor [Erysipelotrichaceae bacterium]